MSLEDKAIDVLKPVLQWVTALSGTPRARKGNFLLCTIRFSRNAIHMIHICDFVVPKYVFAARTHLLRLHLGVKFSVRILCAIWSCIIVSNRAVDLCLPRQGNLGRTTLIDIRGLFCIK